MSKFLPDPCWTDQLKRCPVCGYSREGLVGVVPCPECGSVPPDKAFVVHGVPKGIVGASRRYTITAIGLAVFLGFLVQLWPLAVVVFGVVGLLVIVGLGLVLSMVLVFMGRGKQSGTTRFVFVAGGAYYEPVKANIGAKMTAERFLRWTGAERLTLQRVGPFWRKVRIDLGPKSPVLEAGIRCPDDVEETLKMALEESILAAVPVAAVPVAESNVPAYPSAHMNANRATTTTTNDSTA